jgi:hypothetical protein
MTETDANFMVIVARGSIVVPLRTYETYLSSVSAVALLPDKNGLLLVPLIHDSAGGLLLKIRNIAGDRIVHANEFFRHNGYAENFAEHPCPVRWLTERGGLLIEGIPKL